MEKIAEMTRQAMIDTLLSNGYYASSGEVRHLSALPDGVRLVVLADGSAGYWDSFGEWEYVLMPGQWDKLTVLVI